MFPNIILTNLIKYCNYCLYEPTKLFYNDKSSANYNDRNKTVGIFNLYNNHNYYYYY